MESLFVAVVTALVSVIAAMSALLKWYLPRHDSRLHNPHLAELQAIHACLDVHEDNARKRQNLLFESLDRIERKLSKLSGKGD